MSIAPDKIVYVCAGAVHSAILSESGVLYTFGYGLYGRLGITPVVSYVTKPTAVEVPGNLEIVQVSCGSDHTIIVSKNGTAFGFGNQEKGKLGNNVGVAGAVNTPVAIQIPDNKQIIMSSAALGHSLLLASDGTVFAFGESSEGKLGNDIGDTDQVTTPQQVSIPGNKKIVHISAGKSHSMLVAEDGTVLVMGGASNGKLCNGGTVPGPHVKLATAIAIPNNKKIVKAFAGFLASLMIAEDGTVFTCGDKASGGLGNGQTSGVTSSPIAITIPNSKKIVDGFISNTFISSAAISEDGTLFMYGHNSGGKLGNGLTSGSVSTPTATTIPGNKKIVDVALGQDHTIALAEDGTVYSFGIQSFGRLGNDVAANSFQTVPMEIVKGLPECNCNGHGTCDKGFSECKCISNFNATSYCDSCLEGYAGENCTEIICDGISNINASAVCSGHGECVAPDNCKCDDGWESDPFCNVFRCFKTPSNSPQVCSGRGQCVEMDYCKCSQGYGGYKCQRLCSYCYKNHRL